MSTTITDPAAILAYPAHMDTLIVSDKIGECFRWHDKDGTAYDKWEWTLRRFATEEQEAFWDGVVTQYKAAKTAEIAESEGEEEAPARKKQSKKKRSTGKKAPARRNKKRKTLKSQTVLPTKAARSSKVQDEEVAEYQASEDEKSVRHAKEEIVTVPQGSKLLSHEEVMELDQLLKKKKINGKNDATNRTYLKDAILAVKLSRDTMDLTVGEAPMDLKKQLAGKWKPTVSLAAAKRWLIARAICSPVVGADKSFNSMPNLDAVEKYLVAQTKKTPLAFFRFLKSYILTTVLGEKSGIDKNEICRSKKILIQYGRMIIGERKLTAFWSNAFVTEYYKEKKHVLEDEGHDDWPAVWDEVDSITKGMQWEIAVLCDRVLSKFRAPANALDNKVFFVTKEEKKKGFHGNKGATFW